MAVRKRKAGWGSENEQGTAAECTLLVAKKGPPEKTDVQEGKSSWTLSKRGGGITRTLNHSLLRGLLCFQTQLFKS